MWTFAAASTLALLAGLTPAAVDDPSKNPPQPDTAPKWVLSMRALGGVTATDPHHPAIAIGVGHSATYRGALQYQPSGSGWLGYVHGAIGRRVFSQARWVAAIDLEHTHVWTSRALVQGTGWKLEGHDIRQLTVIAASGLFARRAFGVIDSVEVGGGRMHILSRVSADARGTALGPISPPILEASAPVGLVGVHLTKNVRWGVVGKAHVRFVGAGASREAEVPYAYFTANWDLVRPVFQSRRYGRGSFGLSGSHASDSRAATYFQNGLGLTFRIEF